MTESLMFDALEGDYGNPASRPTPCPSNPEVLDLEGLCDRCLGNLDLVERVLDRFEDRLPEELAELERTLALGDAASIALVAHRIRGNSSNVSAASLQHAAEELEDLSRAGRVEEVAARLPRLREECERFVEFRASLRSAAGIGARDSAPDSRTESSSEAVS